MSSPCWFNWDLSLHKILISLWQSLNLRPNALSVKAFTMVKTSSVSRTDTYKEKKGRETKEQLTQLDQSAQSDSSLALILPWTLLGICLYSCSPKYRQASRFLLILHIHTNLFFLHSECQKFINNWIIILAKYFHFTIAKKLYKFWAAKFISLKANLKVTLRENSWKT